MRPIIFVALAVLLLAGMPQSCLAEVEVDAEVRAALQRRLTIALASS